MRWLFLLILCNYSLFAQSSFQKGEKYYFQEKFAIALKFLESAKKEDPENPKVWSYSGDIYFIDGKLEAALEHYKVAADLSGNPSDDLYRRGLVEYRLSEGEKARLSFEKALKADPRCYRCQYSLGLVYLHLLKELKAALETFTQFLLMNPPAEELPHVKLLIDQLKNPESANEKLAVDCIEIPSPVYRREGDIVPKEDSSNESKEGKDAKSNSGNGINVSSELKPEGLIEASESKASEKKTEDRVENQGKDQVEPKSKNPQEGIP